MSEESSGNMRYFLSFMINSAVTVGRRDSEGQTDKYNKLIVCMYLLRGLWRNKKLLNRLTYLSASKNRENREREEDKSSERGSSNWRTTDSPYT